MQVRNVSTVPTQPTSNERFVRALSMASVTLALVGAVSIIPVPSTADAVTPSSSITVKWTGDSSSARDFQPIRNPNSPHFPEFDNLSVTVSQTAGVIDQAIRVQVSGFDAGTQSSTTFGSDVQNFVQAMQCWGEDPRADDFVETCQWGGRYAANNGLGNSVFPDVTQRVAPRDQDIFNPTDHDVQFRTVDGQVISGKNQLVNGEEKYAILDFFGPATTNEVSSARVGSDGIGFFDFEAQSASQAPQLGCGTAENLRCWLVIVPRGTVFGGDGAACSPIRDRANSFELYPYGRANSIQAGSPVNTNCDYWDNRIAIPLDFAAVGSSCEIGAPEFRVVGSQLMVGAMSSWQPALCTSLKSTFNFATNTDSIARAQLIEDGANAPRIAYSGYPVSSGELQTEAERTLLARAKLAYAPVGISAVTIAYIAEFDAGRQEKLVLSPRLMAKLLTQSYRFTVPSNTSDPAKNFAHLGATNQRYVFLNQDPDFQSLNPTNFNQFTTNPAIVLPGPSGADAIRQVWRWILADTEARAFLDGTPDPWGMTVNPYYLPKGDPKAVVPWWLDDARNYREPPVERAVGLTKIDGSPQRLSTTILETFPKDDESLVPLNLNTERSRFDSIQFAPYTSDLLSAALRTFRANPNSRTTWDPIRTNASGEAGDWVSSGRQLPGSKFMISISDSPSTVRYGLSAASVRLPNSTVVANPDAAGIAAALSALAATTLATVKQVDPSAVTAGGYPLTMVTYAAVNMGASTQAQRTTIANMLAQVTTNGQVSGTATGNLPPGYLPLTAELLAQAVSATNLVRIYPAVPTTPPTTTRPPVSSLGSFDTGSPVAEAAASETPTDLGVEAEEPAFTAALSSGPLERGGVLIALGLGVAGLLFAPLLFRGRRQS